MKLTRRSRLLCDLLAALCLGLLALAQWQFPPFTVHGMCREVGRMLLMTTPETIYVEQELSPRYNGSRDWHTTVIARSGDTWVGFQYGRSGLRPWELRYPTPFALEKGPMVLSANGKLYLAGDFPAEAVAVRGEAIATPTKRTFLADGTWTEKEYGEPVVFPLAGEAVAEGVFLLPYQDSDRYGDATEDIQLGQFIRENYMELSELSTGYAIAHEEVPLTFTLLDADGRELQTLHLTLGTYDLMERW